MQVDRDARFMSSSCLLKLFFWEQLPLTKLYSSRDSIKHVSADYSTIRLVTGYVTSVLTR